MKNLKAESSIFTDRARYMQSQLAVNSKLQKVQTDTLSYENVYFLYCSTLLPFIAIKRVIGTFWYHLMLPKTIPKAMTNNKLFFEKINVIHKPESNFRYRLDFFLEIRLIVLHVYSE